MQGYAYQPNGYVQTGLGFEPNYGRTYATPVQRYEFNTNQMVSLNQVSLQGVSFAPAVTYASQVSAGPATMLTTTQNDLNKVVSGNDMPGYPRVNSVPPRSLNCNGYSGDFGGSNQSNNALQQQQQSNSQHQQQQQQQQSNPNQMHPPQVPQSPNRSNMNTPVSHNMMIPSGPSSSHIQQIPQSPNHLNNNNNSSNGSSTQNTATQMQQMQSPNHHHSHQMQTASSGSTTPSSSRYQSPNHNNSQILHSHAGMHTPNSHHTQQHSNSHTISPNHHMNQQVPGAASTQDWAWNSSSHSQTGNDMFNQSDRVNLNTRLKTMILSKNDQKELEQSQQSGSGHHPTSVNQSASQQSQAPTGHFLSYSHHLRDLNHPNAAGNNNSTSRNGCLTTVPPTHGAEPIGGGGDSHWKSPGMPLAKPDDFQFPIKRQDSPNKMDYINRSTPHLNEKSMGDPGGGKTHHKNDHRSAAQKLMQSSQDIPKIKTETEKKPAKRSRKKTSTSDKSDSKTTSNFLPNINSSRIYSNPNQTSAYAGGGFSDAHALLPHHQGYLPSGIGDRIGAFHHAIPHQNPHLFDANMKIKQEPMPASFSSQATPENFDVSAVKMEGYERNYQNFINYADYCQSQNQKNPNQQPQQLEYNPNQDYSTAAGNCAQNVNFPASYHQQNYQQNYNQYAMGGLAAPTHPPTQHSINNMMGGSMSTKSSLDGDDTKPTTLTNYEKDIPVYTYPNPGKIPIDDAKKDEGAYPFLSEDTLRHPSEDSTKEHQPKDEPTTAFDDVDALVDEKIPGSDETVTKDAAQSSADRTEKGSKPEVPDCECFISDKNPPEPGSYYTHLGTCLYKKSSSFSFAPSFKLLKFFFHFKRYANYRISSKFGRFKARL